MSPETSGNLIAVISARKIMAVTRAAKTATTVATGIAEKSGPSNDLFAVDLDEKVDRNSSAKATVSGSFGKTGDEKLLKKLLITLFWLSETCKNRER